MIIKVTVSLLYRKSIRVNLEFGFVNVKCICSPKFAQVHEKNFVALVRERTIPTERPPPVGEVSANFCG